MLKATNDGAASGRRPSASISGIATSGIAAMLSTPSRSVKRITRSPPAIPASVLNDAI
jgi:hypothetical protein